jgi:hypothetical protein
MKHEKKLKGYKIVWTCDFCGEEFKTKKESDKHELICKKNKNREILLRIKIPDKQTLFVLVFIFIGIYLFTFAIANSYAKTNGLGKKYLNNPLIWFSPEEKEKIEITPIPTVEETPTLIPTNKPVVKKNPTVTQTNTVNTPIPNERKKVQVTFTDATIAGTYYCFEDKVNELMTTQNNLSIARKNGELCISGNTQIYNICSDQCRIAGDRCLDLCESSTDVIACGDGCNSKLVDCSKSCSEKNGDCDKWVNDYEKGKAYLKQLKTNYCP